MMRRLKLVTLLLFSLFAIFSSKAIAENKPKSGIEKSVGEHNCGDAGNQKEKDKCERCEYYFNGKGEQVAPHNIKELEDKGQGSTENT